jgi:hypothetical protein
MCLYHTRILELAKVSHLSKKNDNALKKDDKYDLWNEHLK